MIQAVVRTSLFLLCSLVVAQATRLAVADFLAHDGVAADFDRAIRLDPGNESLLAGRAIFQSENGDTSTAVDGALRQALDMNPLDSAAWITLGLRDESRGNSAQAERELEKAATVDRTFKPAWTLANYTFRANRSEKFRRAISRCLSLIEPKDLRPMSFDPGPVFDLCWRQASESKAILDLIPRRGQTLIPYLKFLYETNRMDAAIEAWPLALAVADRTNAAEVDALIGFSERLIAANRIPEAVAVWNELAAKKIVAADDADFRAPALGRGFSWHVEHQTGVFVTESPHALEFEFTGDEPENYELLWKIVPVLPDRTWRVSWQSNFSALDLSGFQFEIAEHSAGAPATCPVMRACAFKAGPETRSVRLGLRYVRAPGTTRGKGILILSSIRLELQP